VVSSETSAWPPGTSTGVGSLPGTDPLAAAALVLEEAPLLPHLPELPARGAGADAVGRSGALLVDLAVQTVAEGWALTGRPGGDRRRALALLDDDLAALEIAALGYTGPLKVQVLGPLTLAASLSRSMGEAAIADPGLRRDLSASLAEGVAGHLAAVQARVPGASLLLQVDEPLLPSVLSGGLSTRSGWGRLAPVEPQEAIDLLATVLLAAPERERRWVHCCARGAPVGLMVSAGAGGVSLDLDAVGTGLDALGQAVEAGACLVLGAVPTTGTPQPDAVTRRVLDLWGRLGFAPAVRRERTVVTPACGLAGLDATAARAAYRAARQAAEAVAEAD
jgi:hypothetical protein